MRRSSSGCLLGHRVLLLFLGWYVYLNASSIRQGGVAAIETVTIQPTTQNQSNCYVTWWAHLYGHDIGKLTVKQRFIESGKTTVTLTKISGDKGDVWKFYRAGPLDTKSGTYMVVFMAHHSSGPRGDISLDHITFTPGCHNRKEFAYVTIIALKRYVN